MSGLGGSSVVTAATSSDSRMASVGSGTDLVGNFKNVSSANKMRLSNTNKMQLLTCQLCGRTFGQMEDLRRHFRTHTGEKPYTCPYCPYRAAVKSSVIRHARTIHGATAT